MKFSLAILLAAACLAISYAQESEEIVTEEPEVITEEPKTEKQICEAAIKECVSKAIGVGVRPWEVMTRVPLVVTKCAVTGPYCAFDVAKQIFTEFFSAVKDSNIRKAAEDFIGRRITRD